MILFIKGLIYDTFWTFRHRRMSRHKSKHQTRSDAWENEYARAIRCINKLDDKDRAAKGLPIIGHYEKRS